MFVLLWSGPDEVKVLGVSEDMEKLRQLAINEGHESYTGLHDPKTIKDQMLLDEVYVGVGEDDPYDVDCSVWITKAVNVL